MKPSNLQKWEKRAHRVRTRMLGTADKPRLSVRRSLKFNYAQMIDDTAGKVLVGVSDMKLKTSGTKVESAKKLGLELAKLAIAKGIKTCVFDRGGYKYHGRVKALADGAREGGLQF